MNRLAVVLFVLLVVSNMAWWMGEAKPPGRAARSPNPALVEENRTLAREVDALREELTTLRQKGVAVPGKTATEARKTARKRRPVAAQGGPTAWTVAQEWVKEALQLADAAKRSAAIEKIRNGFQSSNATEQHAALIALAQVRELEFDKESFRPLVLPFFESDDPAVRRAAIYALYNAGGPKPGDLELILKLADDEAPEVLESSTHAIMLYSKGQLFGPAAEGVLKVLDSDDPRRLREGMRGIWGARASPELQARLIEIAKLPASRHDAVYFALSTLNNKSEAVVEVLIEALGEPGNSGRARWGLGYGVVDAAQPKVADAFLAYFESRSNARERGEVLGVVERYGSLRHLRALERHAGDRSLPERLRRQLEQAVGRMSRRLTR